MYSLIPLEEVRMMWWKTRDSWERPPYKVITDNAAQFTRCILKGLQHHTIVTTSQINKLCFHGILKVVRRIILSHKKRKQGHLLKIGCLCKQPHKSETQVINQLKGTSIGKMPQNTEFFYLSEESLTQQILFQQLNTFFLAEMC